MHRISNRIAAALIMAAVFVGTAHAGARVNTSSGLTPAGAPLALRGYDPVAYFTEGRPVLGASKYMSVHDGAAYEFASAEHKAMFEMSPERYAPRFGGYCAYGVALGAKFDGDPTLWRIVDDRLYVNLNPEISKTWQQDIPGNIVKADGNWAKIKDKAPAELK
ncbi:MAG: hypothetical protein KC466_16870 [Myxococcales bacterium]|nr:hypothetical protein [Myxococcales bacterium]